MELDNNGEKGANGHSNGHNRERFSWTTDIDISNTPDLSEYRIDGEALEQELRSFSFAYDTGVTIYALKEERRIEVAFNVRTADGWRAHDEQENSQKSLKIANSLIRSIKYPFRKPMLSLWQAMRSQKPPIQFEGPYRPSGRGTLVLGIELSRDANYDGCYDTVHRIIATHRLNEYRITKKTFEAQQDPNRQKVFSTTAQHADRTPMEDLLVPPELRDLEDRDGNKVYDEGKRKKPVQPEDAPEAAAVLLREMGRRRY